jgi:KDO2-lipid IV(A) lauroyltransferase
MSDLKNRLEAFVVNSLITAFKSLPLDAASFAGGFIARSIGPLLSAHRTAQKNLDMVFPDMRNADKRRILADMWDNLGRTSVELSHIAGNTLYSRMTIAGLENLPKPGERALFFSGHIGNWELNYSIAFRNGVPVTLIYRQANNPYTDKLITDLRRTQAKDIFPKGMRGAVKLARALKGGDSIALLIDQKMNDGIPVPFFGKEAMTAPAIAEYALRYNAPIIPARVIRTGGVHFDATVYPPLAFTPTGDREKDVLALMTLINQTLEGWIREHPGQWFWVHKRWPKSNYRSQP